MTAKAAGLDFGTFERLYGISGLQLPQPSAAGRQVERHLVVVDAQAIAGMQQVNQPAAAPRQAQGQRGRFGRGVDRDQHLLAGVAAQKSELLMGDVQLLVIAAAQSSARLA